MSIRIGQNKYKWSVGNKASDSLILNNLDNDSDIISLINSNNNTINSNYSNLTINYDNDFLSGIVNKEYRILRNSNQKGIFEKEDFVFSISCNTNTTKIKDDNISNIFNCNFIITNDNNDIISLNSSSNNLNINNYNTIFNIDDNYVKFIDNDYSNIIEINNSNIIIDKDFICKELRTNLIRPINNDDSVELINYNLGINTNLKNAIFGNTAFQPELNKNIIEIQNNSANNINNILEIFNYSNLNCNLVLNINKNGYLNFNNNDNNTAYISFSNSNSDTKHIINLDSKYNGDQFNITKYGNVSIGHSNLSGLLNINRNDDRLNIDEFNDVNINSSNNLLNLNLNFSEKNNYIWHLEENNFLNFLYKDTDKLFPPLFISDLDEDYNNFLTINKNNWDAYFTNLNTGYNWKQISDISQLNYYSNNTLENIVSNNIISNTFFDLYDINNLNKFSNIYINDYNYITIDNNNYVPELKKFYKSNYVYYLTSTEIMNSINYDYSKLKLTIDDNIVNPYFNYLNLETDNKQFKHECKITKWNDGNEKTLFYPSKLYSRSDPNKFVYLTLLSINITNDVDAEIIINNQLNNTDNKTYRDIIGSAIHFLLILHSQENLSLTEINVYKENLINNLKQNIFSEDFSINPRKWQNSVLPNDNYVILNSNITKNWFSIDDFSNNSNTINITNDNYKNYILNKFDSINYNHFIEHKFDNEINSRYYKVDGNREDHKININNNINNNGYFNNYTCLTNFKEKFYIHFEKNLFHLYKQYLLKSDKYISTVYDKPNFINLTSNNNFLAKITDKGTLSFNDVDININENYSIYSSNKNALFNQININSIDSENNIINFNNKNITNIGTIDFNQLQNFDIANINFKNVTNNSNSVIEFNNTGLQVNTSINGIRWTTNVDNIDNTWNEYTNTDFIALFQNKYNKYIENNTNFDFIVFSIEELINFNIPNKSYIVIDGIYYYNYEEKYHNINIYNKNYDTILNINTNNDDNINPALLISGKNPINILNDYETSNMFYTTILSNHSNYLPLNSSIKEDNSVINNIFEIGYYNNSNINIVDDSTYETYNYNNSILRYIADNYNIITVGHNYNICIDNEGIKKPLKKSRWIIDNTTSIQNDITNQILNKDDLFNEINNNSTVILNNPDYYFKNIDYNTIKNSYFKLNNGNNKYILQEETYTELLTSNIKNNFCKISLGVPHNNSNINLYKDGGNYLYNYPRYFNEVIKNNDNDFMLNIFGNTKIYGVDGITNALSIKIDDNTNKVYLSVGNPDNYNDNSNIFDIDGDVYTKNLYVYDNNQYSNIVDIKNNLQTNITENILPEFSNIFETSNINVNKRIDNVETDIIEITTNLENNITENILPEFSNIFETSNTNVNNRIDYIENNFYNNLSNETLPNFLNTYYIHTSNINSNFDGSDKGYFNNELIPPITIDMFDKISAESFKIPNYYDYTHPTIIEGVDYVFQESDITVERNNINNDYKYIDENSNKYFYYKVTSNTKIEINDSINADIIYVGGGGGGYKYQSTKRGGDGGKVFISENNNFNNNTILDIVIGKGGTTGENVSNGDNVTDGENTFIRITSNTTEIDFLQAFGGNSGFTNKDTEYKNYLIQNSGHIISKKMFTFFNHFDDTLIHNLKNRYYNIYDNTDFKNIYLGGTGYIENDDINGLVGGGTGSNYEIIQNSGGGGGSNYANGLQDGADGVVLIRYKFNIVENFFNDSDINTININNFIYNLNYDLLNKKWIFRNTETMQSNYFLNYTDTSSNNIINYFNVFSNQNTLNINKLEIDTLENSNLINTNYNIMKTSNNDINNSINELNYNLSNFDTNFIKFGKIKNDYIDEFDYSKLSKPINNLDRILLDYDYDYNYSDIFNIASNKHVITDTPNNNIKYIVLEYDENSIEQYSSYLVNFYNKTRVNLFILSGGNAAITNNGTVKLGSGGNAILIQNYEFNKYDELTIQVGKGGTSSSSGTSSTYKGNSSSVKLKNRYTDYDKFNITVNATANNGEERYNLDYKITINKTEFHNNYINNSVNSLTQGYLGYRNNNIYDTNYYWGGGGSYNTDGYAGGGGTININNDTFPIIRNNTIDSVNGVKSTGGGGGFNSVNSLYGNGGSGIVIIKILEEIIDVEAEYFYNGYLSFDFFNKKWNLSKLDEVKLSINSNMHQIIDEKIDRFSNLTLTNFYDNFYTCNIDIDQLSNVITGLSIRDNSITYRNIIGFDGKSSNLTDINADIYTLQDSDYNGDGNSIYYKHLIHGKKFSDYSITNNSIADNTIPYNKIFGKISGNKIKDAAIAFSNIDLTNFTSTIKIYSEQDVDATELKNLVIDYSNISNFENYNDTVTIINVNNLDLNANILNNIFIDFSFIKYDNIHNKFSNIYLNMQHGDIINSSNVINTHINYSNIDPNNEFYSNIYLYSDNIISDIKYETIYINYNDITDTALDNTKVYLEGGSIPLSNINNLYLNANQLSDEGELKNVTLTLDEDNKIAPSRIGQVNIKPTEIRWTIEDPYLNMVTIDTTSTNKLFASNIGPVTILPSDIHDGMHISNITIETNNTDKLFASNIGPVTILPTDIYDGMHISNITIQTNTTDKLYASNIGPVTILPSDIQDGMHISNITIQTNNTDKIFASNIGPITLEPIDIYDGMHISNITIDTTTDKLYASNIGPVTISPIDIYDGMHISNITIDTTIEKLFASNIGPVTLEPSDIYDGIFSNVTFDTSIYKIEPSNIGEIEITVNDLNDGIIEGKIILKEVPPNSILPKLVATDIDTVIHSSNLQLYDENGNNLKFPSDMNYNFPTNSIQPSLIDKEIEAEFIKYDSYYGRKWINIGTSISPNSIKTTMLDSNLFSQHLNIGDIVNIDDNTLYHSNVHSFNINEYIEYTNNGVSYYFKPHNDDNYKLHNSKIYCNIDINVLGNNTKVLGDIVQRDIFTKIDNVTVQDIDVKFINNAIATNIIDPSSSTGITKIGGVATILGNIDINFINDVVINTLNTNIITDGDNSSFSGLTTIRGDIDASNIGNADIHIDRDTTTLSGTISGTTRLTGIIDTTNIGEDTDIAFDIIGTLYGSNITNKSISSDKLNNNLILDVNTITFQDGSEFSSNNFYTTTESDNKYVNKNSILYKNNYLNINNYQLPITSNEIDEFLSIDIQCNMFYNNTDIKSKLKIKTYDNNDSIELYNNIDDSYIKFDDNILKIKLKNQINDNYDDIVSFSSSSNVFYKPLVVSELLFTDNTNMNSAFVSFLDTNRQLIMNNGSEQLSGQVYNSRNVTGPGFIHCNGIHALFDITAYSSTISSDKRLKNNIKILNYNNELLKLKPVTFNWNDQNRIGENVGFIAQEVEEIFPNLVKDNPDNYKTVNYTGLIPYLISHIQKLEDRINELEKKIS